MATVNPNDTGLLVLLALEILFTGVITPETLTNLQRLPAYPSGGHFRERQALEVPSRV